MNGHQPLPELVVRPIRGEDRDRVLRLFGRLSPQSIYRRFFTLFPSRIVDTRNGTGGFSSPITAGGTMVVTVAGHGGVPAVGATAVIVNVTVANPTAASNLTIWPDLATRPTASDLNWVAGQTVPNLVVVQLSAGGKIDIYNPFGTANVIVDVVGYYG